MTGFAQAQTETSNRSYNFRVIVHLEEDISIGALPMQINRIMDRYLGTPSMPEKMPTVTIHIIEENQATRRGKYDVFIQANAPYSQTIIDLTRLFIKQRMVAGHPKLTAAVAAPPEWLVAAIAAPLLSAHRQTFPGQLSARALAPVATRFNASKPPPNLLTLIQNPVPERYENAYTLYALHSYVFAEILLDINAKNPNLTFHRILQLQRRERKDTQALRLVVEPLLPSDLDLQEWYAQKAGEFLTKQRVQRTGGAVAEEVGYLLTVSANEISKKELKNVTQRIPIARIPTSSQFWRNARPLLASRLEQFIRLLVRSPKAFREPVTQYTNAFQDLILGNGNVAEFKKRINKTDRDFAEVFRRHRQITEYLAAYEVQLGVAIQGLSRFLAVIDAQREKNDNLHPRLTQYLDRLESEMR